MAPKDYPGARPPDTSDLPPAESLRTLARAVQACEGCDLYKGATQAVFGQGYVKSRVMIVGEQPGDREDREGRPFVGPAGKALDDVMEQAGLPRNLVFVTNAVKHFKFEPAGRRRLHKKPGAREIRACRPWLESEARIVRPHVMVCLGATAARAVIGKDFRITADRGAFFETAFCDRTLGTYHPSAILRAPEPEDRRRTARLIAEDLNKVARAIGL